MPKRLLLLLSTLLILNGCASAGIEQTSTEQYISERRADMLSTHHLGATSVRVLTQTDLDFKDCEREQMPCIDALEVRKSSLKEIERLDTLSELWLAQALILDKNSNDRALPTNIEPLFNAYEQSARHAYARLFVAKKPLSDADNLESQRIQTRDFYNFSTQRLSELFYQAALKDPTLAHEPFMRNWVFQSPFNEQGKAAPIPQTLISAAHINFKDLRVRHTQDGVGAPFVSVFSVPSSKENHIINPGYVGASAVLEFAGQTTDAVLKTPQTIVQIVPYNQQNTTVLNHQKVAVAADFSAPIGLWMNRSQFSKNALKGLLHSSDSFVDPKLYMLEPFDPKRRILVMLHGLASSPETWLNVANELIGDERIRKGYQIWLVSYPTQLSIPFNRLNIERLLKTAVQQADPEQTSFASRHMTLIGHSMGGVIARLLVADSGATFWQFITSNGAPLTAKEREKIANVVPYFEFKPMPNIQRAIFISAPHAGSPLTGKWYARWAAGLLKFPARAVKEFTHGLSALNSLAAQRTLNKDLPKEFVTSVNNLSDQDPWTKLAKTLPTNPQVKIHSIIGRESEEGELKDSSDGVVPYWSSHLENANSELVIHSGHSAQEQPRTWAEIKRILHEELDGR